MQKFVNVLAVASSVVSLAVVGSGLYVYVNRASIIDGVKSQVMEAVMGSMGGQGGFLGGGGGNVYICQEDSGQTNPCWDYTYEACPTDGRGGYAGGAGGGAEGMPGVVIIYW